MKLRTCGLVVSAAFVVACVLGSASAQFYQQGPKLVGAGAIDLSEQGGSVALSGDGSTAIFGGPVTMAGPAPPGCTRARTGFGRNRPNWWALAP